MKKYAQFLGEQVRTKSSKVAVVATMLASGSAFAEGAGDNTAAIQSALSSGQSMVSMTTGGLIAMAASVFGVLMVCGLLSRR